MTGSTKKLDLILPEEAGTVAGLFRNRVLRSPEKLAYRYFDKPLNEWCSITWKEVEAQVNRWRSALAKEPLQVGDRVAIMLPNSPQWVFFDLAAHSLGLAVVSLYVNDRPDNISFILQDAGVKILLCEGVESLKRLENINPQLDGLVRVLTLDSIPEESRHERFLCINDWLCDEPLPDVADLAEAEAMATLIYTSGTTGRPKGVMLSHRNILCNAYAGVQSISVFPDDEFLSFLPLSHSLERTVGYYIPMMSGASVAFARSVPLLSEDLVKIRPTVMISVPRIYERVFLVMQNKLKEKPQFMRSLFNLAVSVGWDRFEYIQKRKGWSAKLLLWPFLNALIAKKVMGRFGGRLRFVICGGAPLAERIGKVFISFGLKIQQGYGLTETSPVISVNRIEQNLPASVGETLPGIEVRIEEGEELMTRSSSVMMGYWNNVAATDRIIDPEGWLHTGDKARIENGHIFITGRIKDILVMANGEKVNASDMEEAIMVNSLFQQCLIVGEGKPYLSMLATLEPEEWSRYAEKRGLPGDTELASKEVEEIIIEELAKLLHNFPGYAQVRRAHVSLEPWSVEEGLVTPTLKLRRHLIQQRFQGIIDRLYEGH